MVSLSSTLVETVSINYDDFNESFLTCGTCLCGGNNNPSGQMSFRCPICRESIPLPRGGVSALRPNFLVNQLLDLMAQQRREVVPKCSLHATEELLFCETCDVVFCPHCMGSSHSQGMSDETCEEHTVIPFSIAMKRMSEILLYKAKECINKLNQANESVSLEINRLDRNVERAKEAVEQSFQALLDVIEVRRSTVLRDLDAVHQTKRKVLQEQLDVINSEKSKVESEMEGLQYQVEVRNMTHKISDLTSRLDSLTPLGEPHENSFLCFEGDTEKTLKAVREAVECHGSTRTSTTFPPLCKVAVDASTVHLECKAIITTVDYHGMPRSNGNDPVIVRVTTECGQHVPSTLTDEHDGTYSVVFKPDKAERHQIEVLIFGRPIRNSPCVVEVSSEHNPVMSYGSRGSGSNQFMQPVAAASDSQNVVYVLDTGNCRIKMLSGEDFNFIGHIEGDGLEGKSATGIALSPNNNLVLVNWRSKMVTELSPLGNKIGQFTHEVMEEPIALAVNSLGQVLVADNGAGMVFLFDLNGKLLKRIGKKGQFKFLSAVAVGPNDDILIAADSRIHVYDAKGDFLRDIQVEGRDPTKFGFLADEVVEFLNFYWYTLRQRVFMFNPRRLRMVQLLANMDSKTGI
ncbi:unnamed protein product [Darwinula stevensoni]|uniref:B box-type domain-containing protein n=1 Tax=Darwinula stevensoni TaxID=69355 RepID=A0A7R9A1R2_9CRUS|nr:unnamed protein product [Darwinula stevensoni]CAG0887161.1 unnamed protein product [Darwinula stevensoni]